MRRMILGTDWWTDCDDAVAVRLLARAHKAREVEIIGIGINACMQYSVASLKGFLRSEGVERVPIGIDREATDFGTWGSKFLYQQHLAESFCPDGTNEEAEDAVRLYRRLLAESDGGVEILEIGFLQVIAAVLESTADDISPLDGVELFRKKVAKVWVMAGKWDGDGETEHNFCNNDRSRRGGEAFCRLCPVPVTFLGWEVGFDVITGGELAENDPLHRVLVDHGSANGRCSWDPMLVLMALIGDEEAAGYRTVRGRAAVEIDSGANHFARDLAGLHAYVVRTRASDDYKNEINRRIG